MWDKALATIGRSSFAQQLHGVDGSKVRLVRGKRLSGYTEATESDVWCEVRLVEQVAQHAQEKKAEEKQQTTAEAQTKAETKTAEAAGSADGRVIGLYKVRVKARRDQPVLPANFAFNKLDDASEALAKAAPEWQLQSIVVSSAIRQSSYIIDPATAQVRRSDEFVAVTSLPSRAPVNTAATDTATAANATTTGTGTPTTSSAAVASTSPFELTWTQSFLAAAGVGALGVGSVYLLRYQRRRQLLSRLQSAVRTALSAAPLPLGANARVVRVKGSRISEGMLGCEMEVAGDRPGSAGNGRVKLQAVRSSNTAGQFSDWQVVHSQLTTHDGRTLPLWLPNIKS